MAPNYRVLLEKANIENETRQQIIENQKQIIQNLESIDQTNREMNEALEKQLQLMQAHLTTYDELCKTQNNLLNAYADVIFQLHDLYPDMDSKMPAVAELLKLHIEYNENQLTEIDRMAADYKNTPSEERPEDK